MTFINHNAPCHVIAYIILLILLFW